MQGGMKPAINDDDAHARPLSSRELHYLRMKLALALKAALPNIEKTAVGRYQASQAELKTWQFLANKVLPDLSASHSRVEIEHKGLTQLSRAELELIVSQSGEPHSAKKTAEIEDFTDVEPLSIDDAVSEPRAHEPLRVHDTHASEGARRRARTQAGTQEGGATPLPADDFGTLLPPRPPNNSRKFSKSRTT